MTTNEDQSQLSTRILGEPNHHSLQSCIAQICLILDLPQASDTVVPRLPGQSQLATCYYHIYRFIRVHEFISIYEFQKFIIGFKLR